MRTILLAIATIVLCNTTQVIKAQKAESSLPDSILVTQSELRILFYSNREDTIGFRQLTSKTSLNEYKGKENKHIMHAMNSIKRTMDGNTIYNKIAGVDIIKIQNRPYDPRETHFLNEVWYRTTHKGVLVVGERGYAAPWHDIISPWKVVDCYLVGFDKEVTLIENVEINTKPYPIGKVNPLTESMQYNYPDSLPRDSTMKLTPPVFMNDTIDLKKYLLDNIRYPILAIENNIQGTPSVAFTVNPDRSITNLKIVRSTDLFLDKSVALTLRQMNGMWKAGTANGEEIPVEVVINVEFKLIKQ